jgi:hypothetical protein
MRGEQCRNNAVAGHDVCSVHLGVAVRTTLFSQDVADRLVTMLRAGNYLHVAVSAAGIGMSTYRDWMRRGRSQKLVDVEHREFRARIESARAEGEARMVAVIARAAQEGDWRAALSLLEREFPERWGPVSVRQRDDAMPQQPEESPVDESDPFREVDELAQRRRTRTG